MNKQKSPIPDKSAFWNNEYMMFRAMGRDPREAVELAGIVTKFEELRRIGVVDFTVEPDIEPYDFSDIEGCTDLTYAQKAARIAEIERKIEDQGQWMLVSKFRCGACNKWHTVQMIGGFIGDEVGNERSAWHIRVKNAAITEYAVDLLKGYFD